MMTLPKRAWLVLVLVLLGPSVRGDEPRPVISIRAVHPDRQVLEVIKLFEGSKAPHPAAALAGWKRASREPERLGKPLEALIAIFNPRMAEEFRTLDEAEASLWFEPDGRLGWGVSLPKDDGTFSALASAFVLSGGRSEAPEAGLAVDRLGGPGSPLMARSPRSTLIGGRVEDLRVVLDRSGRNPTPADFAGFQIQVEPGGLVGSKSLIFQRLAEALRPTSSTLKGHVQLADSTLLATFGLESLEPIGVGSIDPGWLNGIPADRAMIGFALAIDQTPQARDAALALADRVERVDPARAGLAPLRLRLGLLARSVGVRIETDLFPHAKGISGWVGSNGKTLDAAVIVFHLDDEAVALRLADQIKSAPGPQPDRVRSLGRVDGRELRLIRWGQSVALGWGDGSLESTWAALAIPGRSAGPSLRLSWGQKPPSMAGGFWLARWPGLAPADSPIAQALTLAPPIVWSAEWMNRSSLKGSATWKDLDASVRRFLERIPLDPPPDR